MKCPLQFTLAYSEKGILSTPEKECLKKECAWWDKAREQCSELSKIGVLIAQNTILAEIADKMPPEQQSGKYRR